jgi:hypothetical protein
MMTFRSTLVRHRRPLLAASCLLLPVLAVSCFRALSLEGRPCPCDEGFVCCPDGLPGSPGTCRAGASCEPGQGELPPPSYDMVLRVDGDGGPAGDAPGPVNPVARPGDVIRLSSSSVEVIPAFVTCLGASLVHTDGTEEPLVSEDGIIESRNLDSQIAGASGPGCPAAPGEPPYILAVGGLAPGDARVMWTWRFGDMTLDATVRVKVLPYSFRITSDKVVVPQHERAPLPFTVTVLDENDQPSSWGGVGHVVSSNAIRIDVADEDIARLWQTDLDLQIEGLKPGLTSYTLHYFFPYGPEYINPAQDIVVLEDANVTGLEIRLFERQPPYDEIAAGQVLLPGACYEARGFVITQSSSGEHTEALNDGAWSTEGDGASLQSTSPTVLCTQPQGHGQTTLSLCARDHCTSSTYPVVDPSRLELSAVGPPAPTPVRQVAGAARYCPAAVVTAHYLDDDSRADVTVDPSLLWSTDAGLSRATDPATGGALFDDMGHPCFEPGAAMPGTVVVTTTNYVGGPAAPATFQWTVGGAP